MNFKKYISVIICAIIVLISALVGIQTENVKIKTTGSGQKIESIQDVGEVLETFSQGRIGFGEEEFKSATIHIEFWDEGSSQSVYEESSLYIGEKASYYKFNGTIAQSFSDGKVKEQILTTYTIEKYEDEDVSLIRISDYFNGKRVINDSEEVKEKKAVPNGLQLNKWYELSEINKFYSLVYGEGHKELSTLSMRVLFNKDNFKYLYKEDGINKGAFMGGVFQYKVLDEGSGTDYCEILVKNDGKKTLITLDEEIKFSKTQIKVSLENINSTVVKSLKRVKVANVDVDALIEKEGA